MTKLEQRCRKLVKFWRRSLPIGVWNAAIVSCAADLEAILPKRKAKKGAKR